jgi:polyphosphate kinase
MPSRLRRFVMQELKVSSARASCRKGLIGLEAINQLIVSDRRSSNSSPSSAASERIREHHGDCFAAIRKKDIVVHHPYGRSTSLQFLKQAAADPDVVAIKWTLYRTSKTSPIIEVLKEAAKPASRSPPWSGAQGPSTRRPTSNGRAISKARASVVYGFIELKTHAKLSLIVRRRRAS